MDAAGNRSAWTALPGITTAAGGTPSGATRWLNLSRNDIVNGQATYVAPDGILDKVIGVDGNRFSAAVSSSSWSYSFNNFWTLWGITWPDGSFTPNFTYALLMEPFWDEGMPVNTSIDVDLSFEAEPGHEYAVLRDDSASHVFDLENTGIVAYPVSFPLGGLQHIYTGLSLSELQFAKFYLVRYGAPLGSVAVGGSSVTLGTTRGSGGTLSIPFPPGGNVILSIKDAVGQALKAGSSIAYEVWDGITQIRVGAGTTLGDLLDIGVTPAGDFQIGLKLDDSTMLWFNLTVQASEPPRILLLLHGMNSNRFTWDDFVTNIFGGSSTDIVNGALTGSAPIPNSKGVYCYRLQFGAYDSASPRVGLEQMTAANTPGYLNNVDVRCGDFETFETLGQEVHDAVTVLLAAHPNASIVLVGHSRGGLAARAFLQGSSSRKTAVIGLMTTSSPHLGSRLGKIYEWLQGHSRPSNGIDWDVVDFLLEPSYLGFPKETLDVRRPIIGDLANNSLALANLNAPSALANLPSISYGEIIYDGMEIGQLTKSLPSYSIFFRSVSLNIGKQLSSAAADFLLGPGEAARLGLESPPLFHGDGLIQAGNQVFTQMDGFGGIAISRMIVADGDVIHTDAPNQFNDLLTQLRALNPAWWPSP